MRVSSTRMRTRPYYYARKRAHVRAYARTRPRIMRAHYAHACAPGHYARVRALLRVRSRVRSGIRYSDSYSFISTTNTASKALIRGYNRSHSPF